MRPVLERSLVLIGAGGHAASCIDVIREEKKHEIIGLIGRADELGRAVSGFSVIGTDSDLGSSGKLIAQSAIVVVGHIRSAESRIRLFSHLSLLGYMLPSIISPLAHASLSARIGAGTIVMHGAIVNAGAQVGVNCIINSRALLEHGVTVGDHCHISTAAVVNGDAVIGDGTFVGSGAVIREGVRIGRRCLIGMGAIVRHDLPDESVFYGTPHHGA